MQNQLINLYLALLLIMLVGAILTIDLVLTATIRRVIRRIGRRITMPANRRELAPVPIRTPLASASRRRYGRDEPIAR